MRRCIAFSVGSHRPCSGPVRQKRTHGVGGCRLDRLEAFASLNGPWFHGLSPNEQQVTSHSPLLVVSERIGVSYGDKSVVVVRAAGRVLVTEPEAGTTSCETCAAEWLHHSTRRADPRRRHHSARARPRSSCSKALAMRLISADRAPASLAVVRQVAVTAATCLMIARA